MSSTNPFAAPQSMGAAVPTIAAYWREGMLLVANPNAELPAR